MRKIDRFKMMMKYRISVAAYFLKVGLCLALFLLAAYILRVGLPLLFQVILFFGALVGWTIVWFSWDIPEEPTFNQESKL